MGTQWRIEMLGGLRARHGEEIRTHFETRRTAALLAYLAFYRRQAFSREGLAERLWPDEPIEATRDRFRQTLSTLRQMLEPPGVPAGSVLVADRLTARLDPAAVGTDVADFDEALGRAQRASMPEERLGSLRRALDLYAGELLPGSYDDWIALERERLAEAFRQALHQTVAALAEAGDLDTAIEVGRRAVAQDPLREDAHCGLMRLYARVGRIPEVLRQYRELERILREEFGAVPSDATRAVLEELRQGTTPILREVRPGTSAVASSPAAGTGAVDVPLEAEGGAVPLDSRFYIVRPTDGQFHTAITRRDSIVLVKGARQMGKTSLLARGLQQAREAGTRTVCTDLQMLTAEQLQSADELFLTLAGEIADQLDLDLDLGTLWRTDRGWNVNFERFIRREVLGRIDMPVVWALDEVDRLFGHPFSTEVFGLFRAWHNQRSLNPTGPWGRLTLAIAYATEAHLFITDLNQSPFNVGTRLALEDFTPGEVGELNRRYQSPLSDEAEVKRYLRLVGGHPYLVRRGLHAMVENGWGITSLEVEAEDDEGIYGDHLRRMLTGIRQDPALGEAVRSVLRQGSCPDAESFYRLRSAGVIAGASEEDARLRCRLYQRYLERHLA